MVDPVTSTAALAVVGAKEERHAQRQTSPESKPRNLSGEPEASAKAAVEKMLKALEPPLMGQNERLSIIRDPATGIFVYRSIDTSSGKVVRQWPAEAMLQFKAYLRQGGVAYDAGA